MLMLLTRTIRIHSDHATPDGDVQKGTAPAAINARCDEFEVVCGGEPDHATAMIVNIQEIDRAAIGAIGTALVHARRNTPGAAPVGLMKHLLLAAATSLPQHRVAVLRWTLTPNDVLEMEADAMDSVLLKHKTYFSASHRLYAPSLSEEENRRIYGLCCNENGHGHNYGVMPEVAVPVPQGNEPPAMDHAGLANACKEAIEKPYDHKHLNVDTEDFKDVNPSVEMIAIRCFERLRDELAETAPRAELRRITVWETEKTSCTFPA